MLAAARAAVAEAGLENVTLRQAAAERLPLANASVDVAVVNGLFNLAPDKHAVVRELARVVRSGGRLVGAEIVITDGREAQEFDPESWFR
jgi:ubiquinone/menaquinone biosynthesis C-methylase UbiE